jgi:prephenate dehydrogenase
MKYCIIGAGLIGGSLAKACREHGLVSHITAVDTDRDSLHLLQAEGAIDAGYETLTSQAVAEAECIIIATPPHSWNAVADSLAPLLTPAVRLIMDVGSVKGYALECFGTLPHFVPAHPIAGSEFSGAAFSVAELFAGKRVILTPTSHTDPMALALAEQCWQGIGAHVVMLEAKLHDSIYAYVSHLPQLVAYAVALAWLPQGTPPTTDNVSAAFYRLCGSSPALWTGIFQHNAHIKEAAEMYLRILTHMIAELRTGVLSQADSGVTTIGLELSPRIIASCLISCANLAEKKHEHGMARYAGAGFADMTHPAMSDPADDLARISEHTNAVVDCLVQVEEQMRTLLLMMHEGEWDALHLLVEKAQGVYLHHL